MRLFDAIGVTAFSPLANKLREKFQFHRKFSRYTFDTSDKGASTYETKILSTPIFLTVDVHLSLGNAKMSDYWNNGFDLQAKINW